MALVVKNLSANAGGVKRLWFEPGSGRSPGGGHGKPLPYSCLEKPMDRGAWQVTVHGVTKSQTQTKSLSTAQITIYPPEVSLIFSCLLHSLSQGKQPEIKPRLLGMSSITSPTNTRGTGVNFTPRAESTCPQLHFQTFPRRLALPCRELRGRQGLVSLEMAAAPSGNRKSFPVGAE